MDHSVSELYELGKHTGQGLVGRLLSCWEYWDRTVKLNGLVTCLIWACSVVGHVSGKTGAVPYPGQRRRAFKFLSAKDLNALQEGAVRVLRSRLNWMGIPAQSMFWSKVMSWGLRQTRYSSVPPGHRMF